MKKYIVCILIFAAFAIQVNAQDNLQRTPEGALYRIFTHNTGDKLKINDVITIDVIQKTDKDSVLFNSYTTGNPGKLQVHSPQESSSLTEKAMMEIFPLLTVKDSVLVRIPTDSIFKGHEEARPPFFPAGSNLNYYIKIEKVESLTDAMAERNADIHQAKTQEKADAAAYIAANKLIVKTTPSGLKYVVLKASIKPKPLPGDTVLVNYTGRLLSGQVFDSSIQAVAQQAGLQQPGRIYEPIKVVVGGGQVIKGWDEGLLLLNEGSAGMFIIPSDLAYGEQGGGDVIKPFSTLVFDIEIEKVIRVKHAVPPATKKLPVKHHTAAKKKS